MGAKTELNTDNIQPITMEDKINPVSQALQNINTVHENNVDIFGYGRYSLTMEIYTHRMTTTFYYHNGFEEFNAPNMNQLWLATLQMINDIVELSDNEYLTKFVADNLWWIP